MITQFPLRGRPRDGGVPGRAPPPGRRRELRHRRLRCRPPASARSASPPRPRMRIVADTAVGPWVAFELFEKLEVDSASWEGGEKATVVRGKESPLLWVLLDRQIRPGDVRTLRAPLSRRPDRPLRGLLPHQVLRGVVPALAGGPEPREVRSHLHDRVQLPPRQRGRPGRLQHVTAAPRARAG